MTSGAVQVARRASCPQCLAQFRTRPRRCPRDGAALVESEVDPMIGTVIGQRYLIEASIGAGGIGQVYRAKHTRISRQYAIKIPFGELAFDEAIRKRLANEAEAASRVSHPNLVGVIDVGETEAGLFYLVMDLVTGPSLATILEDGPLSIERALTLVARIADGLAHAHARGLVHRDLKPDNVIVERDADGHDHPRIVDFGIALVQDEAHRRMTAEGMVIGTPEYMAPEQLVGQPVDARTDLFALGLVLYELVTGVTPFAGAALEIATKNLTAELPPMATRAPGRKIDARIERLVRWMTEKQPDQRPGDAELVADTIRALLEDPALSATPLPPRRKPITFSPLALAAAPGAGHAQLTAEAWSPIVVPVAVAPTEEISASMILPPTGEQRVSATIVSPVVPPPTVSLRARGIGSEPPPPGQAAWPPPPAGDDAWLPARAAVADAPAPGAPTPWWRRPRLLIAAAIAGAVIAVVSIFAAQ